MEVTVEVTLSQIWRQEDRVNTYIFLQRLYSSPDIDVNSPIVCEISKSIWQYIYSDVNSLDDNLAANALRSLGVFMRHSSFATTVSVEQTSRILLTLLDLINNNEEKLLGSLGIWCIAVQNSNSSTLALHLKNILEVVLRWVDNSNRSASKYLGAFQAVAHLSKQLPREMHDFSTMWAPPIYQQLLSNNKKVVLFADECLMEVQSILIPTSALLSKVHKQTLNDVICTLIARKPIHQLIRVEADIQQKLLVRMERMVNSKGSNAVLVVQAWGWLVKLLGEQFMDKITFVNRMLKIVESSFISKTAEMRNTSLVAWNAMIDTLVPSLENVLPHQKPSSKHLKLLMMPLLKTMEFETDARVDNNCFCTWIYLLTRLQRLVNEPWVFDIVVTPVLETVYKLGPTHKTRSVSHTIGKLVVSMMAKTTLGEAPSDMQSLEQLSEPQLIPTFEGSRTKVKHDGTIHWTPWKLDRLPCQLHILQLLWSKAVQDGEYFCEDGYSILEIALECWKSIVKYVGKEGKGNIRSSCEHIFAVHLLLDFLCKFCIECPQRTMKDVALRTWSLIQVLISELGLIVLASSLYRKQISLGSRNFVQEKVCNPGQIDPTTRLVKIAPIMIISAAWLSLVFKHPSDEAQDVVKSAIVQLLQTTGGFDVIDDFQWFASILDQLKQVDPWFHREGYWHKSVVRNMENDNMTLLFKVWGAVSNILAEHLQKLNDVPCTKSGTCYSGHRVVCNLLIFPFNYLLQRSSGEHMQKRKYRVESPSCMSNLGSRVELNLPHVVATWVQLYDSVSRISSIRNGNCNAFSAILFCEILKIIKISPITELKGNIADQCAEFLSGVISHSMIHTEISSSAKPKMIKNRRQSGYGASSLHVKLQTEDDPEDLNNIRDLLIVSGRLLNIFCRTFVNHEGSFNHEFVIKILHEFSCLAHRVTSQNDGLLLLQAFSYPMTKWLTLGIDISTSSGATWHIPQELLQALAKAWDALLSSIQKCHPELVFDSDLLALQDRSLSVALFHGYSPIGKRTLCYWKSTYGSTTVYLDYPQHLKLVLRKLNLKDMKSYSGDASAQSRQLVEDLPNTTSAKMTPECGEPMYPSIYVTKNGLIASTIGLAGIEFQEKAMTTEKLTSTKCSQAFQLEAFEKSCSNEPNNQEVLIADVANGSNPMSSYPIALCQEGDMTLFPFNNDYAQRCIDALKPSSLACDGGNVVREDQGKRDDIGETTQQDCLSNVNLVMGKRNSFSSETKENNITEHKTNLVGDFLETESVHTSEVLMPGKLLCGTIREEFICSTPYLKCLPIDIGAPGVDRNVPVDKYCEEALSLPGRQKKSKSNHEIEIMTPLQYHQNYDGESFPAIHDLNELPSTQYRQNCGSKPFPLIEDLNELPPMQTHLYPSNSMGNGNHNKDLVCDVQVSKTDTLLSRAFEMSMWPNPHLREEKALITVVSTLKSNQGKRNATKAYAEEAKLSQLKEKLQLLYVIDPDITFKQVFHSECYDKFPRRMLKKLKCYLHQLRTEPIIPECKHGSALLGPVAAEVAKRSSYGQNWGGTEKDCVLDYMSNCGENVVERTSPDAVERTPPDHEIWTTSTLPASVDMSSMNVYRHDMSNNGEAYGVQVNIPESGIKHIAPKKQHSEDELLEFPNVLDDGWMKTSFKMTGMYSHVCQQADDTVQKAIAYLEHVANRKDEERLTTIQNLNSESFTGKLGAGKIPIHVHGDSNVTTITATTAVKLNKRKSKRPRRIIQCDDGNQTDNPECWMKHYTDVNNRSLGRSEMMDLTQGRLEFQIP